MLAFYIIFSYLFLFGVHTVQNLTWYNFVFSPIFLPIVLGRAITYISIK